MPANKKIIAERSYLNGHVKRPICEAIRDKCLNCCCGDKNLVRTCNCTDCTLWPYRFGINPFSRVRTNDSKNTEHLKDNDDSE